MSVALSPEELANFALGIKKGNCSLLHDHSCGKIFLESFIHGFKFGMKFYFPLHFMPLILKYKQVLKKPLETIKSALKGCVRSTLVLAVMVLMGRICLCSYVNWTGSMDNKVMKISAAIVTLAAFIETPARISEMAMYVMPRFFDAIWKFLIRRGYNVRVPHGQVLLFCLATSAVLYCNHSEPENIKPMYKKACEKFFGVN